MRNAPTGPEASMYFEGLSILEYLFMLQPGQPCPATAHYRSCCACRSESVVETGAPCPRCPRCGATVEWDFVRIDEDRKLSA